MTIIAFQYPTGGYLKLLVKTSPQVWPTADRIDGGSGRERSPVWTRLEKLTRGTRSCREGPLRPSTEHGKTSESQAGQERTMVPVQVTYPARRCTLDLPLQPMGLARPWSAAAYPPTHCTASPLRRVQCPLRFRRRPNVPSIPFSLAHKRTAPRRQSEIAGERMAKSHHS